MLVAQIDAPAKLTKQAASCVVLNGQRTGVSLAQLFRSGVQPNEFKAVHTPAWQRPPTPQGVSSTTTTQAPVLHCWHSPQSASMQQEPGGRHCLPHFTFGALHFFLRFFLAATISGATSAPSTAGMVASTERRGSATATRRESASNSREAMSVPQAPTHDTGHQEGCARLERQECIMKTGTPGGKSSHFR